MVTLVTLGRLTSSLNENGGSQEAVKNKGSTWVEGDRISSPFLTRKEMIQKNKPFGKLISSASYIFEIFEIQNPANGGLLNREET